MLLALVVHILRSGVNVISASIAVNSLLTRSSQCSSRAFVHASSPYASWSSRRIRRNDTTLFASLDNRDIAHQLVSLRIAYA